ncbi:MAG TPA: hypothetical protein VGJ54_17065 [Streptosporangiaceae bacterium]
MISSVVVSYQVRPEAVAEHVRLIEAVFAQLHAEQPDNVEYKVVRLADGVSFVHVSSADTPDGSNPLPDLGQRPPPTACPIRCDSRCSPGAGPRRRQQVRSWSRSPGVRPRGRARRRHAGA